MAVRDHAGTIALCASLALHGLISCYLLNRAAGELSGQTYWSALPVPERTARDSIFVEAPAPPVQPEPAPEPEPAPQRPETTPPAPQIAPDLKPLPIPHPELTPDPGMSRPVPVEGFGEMTGVADATALHSLSGDEPMQAPKWERDQPLIRREPSMRVDGQDEAAAAAKSPPPAAAPAVPAPAEVPSPSPAPAPELKPEQPKSVVEAMEPHTVEGALLAPGPGSDRSTEAEEHARPVEVALASPTPRPPPIPVQAVAPAKPHEVPATLPASTSATPSGEIAPQSDSDSDAFSATGSAEFRPGRVVARFGRAVKTVRPQLSLAGRSELLGHGGAKVVMEIHADEMGRVRDVRVTQSSGSVEIDQPVKLAMYQWWFEPPRDAGGRPKPSVMTWSIHFTVR